MYDGCYPSPSSDRLSPAQKSVRQHCLGPQTCPPRRARLPPHIKIFYFFYIHISNKSQKDLDNLLGEPPGFFLHTHATFTHLLVKNWHLKS